MNEEKQESQVELYKAYSVREILERREMLGRSNSLDSLSSGFSVP